MISEKILKILMIGDIIGKPGRKAVNKLLPGLRYEYGVDLVIANGENVAGGLGITPETAQELFDSGVNTITTGNHIWARKEIIPYLDKLPILRPLNFPPGVPGQGYLVINEALIVNLVGRTFMGEFDCPFRTIEQLLNKFENRPAIIVVDFHAEATSEKVAMGRYLNGKVSAVLGTHTHVGTIDAGVLSKGTAYVTDIGMVGPIDSVIGVDADSVIQRFLTKMPHHLPVAEGKVIFNAVLVNINKVDGKAVTIQRIQQEVD